MTLEVIYRAMEGLKDEYLEAKNDEERGSLANMAVFVLVSFLAALRVEDTLEISLCDTRGYDKEAEQNLQLKHVVLPSRGRSKGKIMRVITLLLFLR